MAIAPVLTFVLTPRLINLIDGPGGRLSEIISFGTLTVDPLISNGAFTILSLVCAGFGSGSVGLILFAYEMLASNHRVSCAFLFVVGLAGLIYGGERIYKAFHGPIFHGDPLPKDVAFEPFVLSFGVAVLISSVILLVMGAVLWFAPRNPTRATSANP